MSGSKSMYLLLALAIAVLLIAILNTNDFDDKIFLSVIPFGIVCFASIIRAMMKEN
jgi:hypothetical protein